MNDNLTIIDHPLVQHKLTLMRRRKPQVPLFVSYLGDFHAPGL